MPLHPGYRLGHFRLVREIGMGGNARVWECSDEQSGQAIAVKILNTRNPDSEPWRRFAREAALQRQLTSQLFPGILPLIDYDIPPRGSNSRAWLAMPLARTTADVFGAAPELKAVVKAIRQVADALARLHATGVAHRDVKPANIYALHGAWVIGDFGLVEVPDAESLTGGAQGPGSQHYIAPELLRDPDSPGAVADVYSLAKTLWVLSTGQRYPPPGEHRIEVEAVRISVYSADPRARLLDSLLEAATRLDPRRRPTMAQMASDLQTWLQPSIREPTDLVDLSELSRGITAIIAPDQRLQEAEARQKQAALTTLNRMVQRLQDLPRVLRSLGLPVKSDVFIPAEGSLLGVLFKEEQRDVDFRCVASALLQVRGRREPRGRETIMEAKLAVAGVLDRDELILAAGYYLPGSTPFKIAWREHQQAIIGSASEEAAIAGLTTHMRERIPAAMKAFLDDLTE